MLRSSLVLTLVAVLSGCQPVAIRSPAAPASSTSPATPAEKRLREWLAAFNTQDEAAYRRYVLASAPALEKYIRDDHRYAVLLGGFELMAVRAVGATEAHADLRDPYSDAVTALTIKVETAPPYRITTADLAPPKIDTRAIRQFASERELVRSLRRRLEKQSSDGRFSGVVLVANGRRMLFQGAYGQARGALPACAPADLAFNLASMGKMMTAVAVMQLVERGQVALDAPLARYLPDYGNAEFAAAVTIRQLLNHTAGAGDIFVKEVEQRRDSLQSLADFVAILQARTTQFVPGSKWAYSNYGYVLLGRVIEVVSGQAYPDYLRAHVLPDAPSASACRQELPGITRGDDGIAWTPRKPGLERKPTSAGGFAASARQLLDFANDLRDAKLLSPQSTTTLLQGTVTIPGGRYALGFKDLVRNELRYVGHGGSAPGINNELNLSPASGLIVIVLTNQDPPYGNRVADYIGHRVRVLAAADRVLQPGAAKN